MLVDGDDFNDPMPDAARSVLDGHINLSRSFTTKGFFPAVDTTTSVSRVMQDVISEEHKKYARYLRALIAVYTENYDFIQLGSYQAGNNPLLDQAINMMPHIEAFLKQDMYEYSSFKQTLESMVGLFHEHE